MNKKGNTAIVTLTVVVIIGIIALSVGWELIQDKTTSETITDDTFTGLNGTCTRVTSASDRCILSTTNIQNATGNQVDVSGNFTVCGTTSGSDLNGYYVSATPNFVGQSFNASYLEVACTQLTGTTGTIANYVPLLWAVVILVFVAGFIGVGFAMR